MEDITEESVEVIMTEPETQPVTVHLPTPWTAVNERFPHLSPVHLQQLSDEFDACHQLIRATLSPGQPPRGTSARVCRTLIRSKHIIDTLQLQLSGIQSGHHELHALQTAGFTVTDMAQAAEITTGFISRVQHEQDRLETVAEPAFKPDIWAHMQQKRLLAPASPQRKK